MNAPARVILVGCGKMGGALLKRAVSAYPSATANPFIYVVDPTAPALDPSPSVCWVSSPDKISAAFAPDVIIFAIKPQQIAATLPAYARYADKCVFLSIAAGVTLNDLAQSIAPHNTAIVRSMPNLPASIGEGVTALIGNDRVTDEQRKICSEFMAHAGTIVWLDDEKLMNAVTALSGSGPAYVFALCEAMAKAGEALGLSAVNSLNLARQTIVGSAALLNASTETPATLRQAVTSPGGTTEAALKVMTATGGLFDVMLNAMKAASQRGEELSVISNGKNKVGIQDKLCAAALVLAAKFPWQNVTLDQIAMRAKVSAQDVSAHYKTRDAIIPDIIRHIDKKLAANFKGRKLDGSIRDNLFEVLMARFDLLQEHRSAHISIAKALRLNPLQAFTLLGVIKHSMAETFKILGVDANTTQVAGLTALFLVTSYAWERDASADLSKTMAALDKNLNRADKLMTQCAKLFPHNR